jgi:hypothetical protein
MPTSDEAKAFVAIGEKKHGNSSCPDLGAGIALIAGPTTAALK